MLAGPRRRIPCLSGERDIRVMGWPPAEGTELIVHCAVANLEAWCILKTIGWKNKFTKISQTRHHFLIYSSGNKLHFQKKHGKHSQRWWKFLGKNSKDLGQRRVCPTWVKQNRGKGMGQPPIPSVWENRICFSRSFLEMSTFQWKKGWKGGWKHFFCLQHSLYTECQELG